MFQSSFENNSRNDLTIGWTLTIRCGRGKRGIEPYQNFRVNVNISEDTLP